MSTFLSIIVLGFFLGMRHATDSDHVVAVTTIVSRQPSMRSAALIGLLWGTGHTLTIFFVGSAIILFGVVISPKLGLTMELSVGVMLIVLGIMNLSGMMRWITGPFRSSHAESIPGDHTRIHSHYYSHLHSHDGYLHSHPRIPENHAHSQNATPLRWMDRNFATLGVYHVLRPVIVGVVHGLAGSAAVALLVLTTIRNSYWAIAYLLVFGVGTIAGMMLITVAIALPFKYTQNRFARLNRALGLASGLASLALGLLIVYKMGYVNGVFTSHPQWVPR